MRDLGRRFLFVAAATAVTACGSGPEYAEPYDSEFTVAKRDVMVTGYTGGTRLGGEGPPEVEANGEFAVRYMGLDANGDPILQVLSPDLKRTDVVVEQAETDRVHLGAYGVRTVTVVVVDATDARLKYRLKRDTR